MKRNNLYLSLILVVFTLFSCTHRSYRMQTQVNRDGSCVRSISVETRDSAFIAGDTTANPLPIQLDTTWTVECYNGQQKVTWPVVNFALFQTDTLPRLTIVASRRFPSVEAMAENFHFYGVFVNLLSFSRRNSDGFTPIILIPKPIPHFQSSPRFRWIIILPPRNRHYGFREMIRLFKGKTALNYAIYCQKSNLKPIFG